MIKTFIGIVIGGAMAMMFPEQAAEIYELVRGSINESSQAIVEATK